MTLDDLFMARHFDLGQLTGAITATADTRQSGTATEILARMKAAMRELEADHAVRRAFAQALDIGSGCYVIEHNLPPMVVPNRKHKKRRSQTEAYHQRVQKKWTKRWGTHLEQSVYFVDMDYMRLFPTGSAAHALVVPRGRAVQAKVQAELAGEGA